MCLLEKIDILPSKTSPMSTYFAKIKVMVERSENLPHIATADNIALIPDIIFEYGKLLYDIKEEGVIDVTNLINNISTIDCNYKKARNEIKFNDKQAEYEKAKKLLLEDLRKLLNHLS